MAEKNPRDIETAEKDIASILKTYQDSVKKAIPAQQGFLATLFGTRKELSSEITRLKTLARERSRHIEDLKTQARTLNVERETRETLIQQKRRETKERKDSTEKIVKESGERSAYIQRDQESLIKEIQANEQYVQEIQARKNAGEVISDSDQRRLAEQEELTSRVAENTKKLQEEHTIRQNAEKKLKDHEKSIVQLSMENRQLAGIIRGVGTQLGTLQTEAKNTEKHLGGLKEGQKLVSVFRKVAQGMDTVAKEIGQLVKVIRDTQQAFGLAAGQAIQLRLTNLVASVQSYFNTLIAGTTPVSQKEILKTQEDFFAEFGEVVSSQSAEALAGYAKQEGITSKMMADARRAFLTTSMGDINKAITNTNAFVGTFKSSGLSTKAAFQAIQQYSDLIARNGSRFQTSFARAAADAKRIGIDLNKVDQIGDNIIGNFEGFLEKSAELGAMGFGLDTTRLAELAEGGDTGALFNELRSQLAATGKDLTKLRRSEQLALSETFGLSMAEFQRLAGITTGAGEKTQEQLTEETNNILTGIFNRLEATTPIVKGVSFLAGLAARGLELILLGQIAAGINALVLKSGIPSAGGALSSALKITSALAGVAVALGGAYTAYQAGKQSESALGAIGKGIGIGTIAGAGAAVLLAPVTGGLSLAALPGIIGTGAAIGAVGGGALGGIGYANKGDDVLSRSGYGQRTLVTPTSVIPLNNQDNIVAYADDMVAQNTGIELLSKGAITNNANASLAPVVNMDLRALEAKLDAVVTAISSMNVHMDGIHVGRVLATTTNTVESVGVLRKPVNTY